MVIYFRYLWRHFMSITAPVLQPYYTIYIHHHVSLALPLPLSLSRSPLYLSLSSFPFPYWLPPSDSGPTRRHLLAEQEVWLPVPGIRHTRACTHHCISAKAGIPQPSRQTVHTISSPKSRYYPTYTHKLYTFDLFASIRRSLNCVTHQQGTDSAHTPGSQTSPPSTGSYNSKRRKDMLKGMS